MPKEELSSQGQHFGFPPKNQAELLDNIYNKYVFPTKAHKAWAAIFLELLVPNAILLSCYT